MVNLGKVGLVAEVDLTSREDGSKIGIGQIERTRSGYVIVHVDLSTIPDFVESGFSIGPIAVHEGE